MRDVSYPAQKSYLLALAGIIYNSVAVPVYYQMLPDNVTPENYIIFGPVSNVDTSTKNSSDTDTSMRVTIHTFEQKYNTGKAASFIAGEVFARIYPNSQAKLDLSPDNLQMVSTELSMDITQDYNMQNSRVYIDRILTFRHKIFHR